MQKIFIILPAYNEAGRIASVLQSLQNEGFSNLVVIDDGSTDQTAQIARENGALVLTHAINCGPGAATQTGLSFALEAGADILVTYDADGQHAASDVKTVIAPILQKTYDACLGSRFLQKNKIPLLRRFFNWLGNLITFLIAWIWVSDSQSGFKAFSREAAQKIEITMNGYEFCSEIIRKISEQKLKFCEVPVTVFYTHESLAKGQSFANGVKTAAKLIIRSLTN